MYTKVYSFISFELNMIEANCKNWHIPENPFYNMVWAIIMEES